MLDVNPLLLGDMIVDGLRPTSRGATMGIPPKLEHELEHMWTQDVLLRPTAVVMEMCMREVEADSAHDEGIISGLI